MELTIQELRKYLRQVGKGRMQELADSVPMSRTTLYRVVRGEVDPPAALIEAVKGKYSVPMLERKSKC